MTGKKKMAKRATAKPRKLHREVGGGRLVTKTYAEAHPDTTVTETVKLTPRGEILSAFNAGVVTEQKRIAGGLRGLARRVLRRYGAAGKVEARTLRDMARWIGRGEFPLHRRDRKIPIPYLLPGLIPVASPPKAAAKKSGGRRSR